MIFKDYINITKNNTIYSTDLFIIKNINEFIEFLSLFNKEIAYKIEQNELINKEDCLFLKQYFDIDFFDFIMEKIEDENILFSENFGIVFILTLRKDNTVYENYSYISELENIEFEEKIKYLINKAENNE